MTRRYHAPVKPITEARACLKQIEQRLRAKDRELAEMRNAGMVLIRFLAALNNHTKIDNKLIREAKKAMALIQKV